MNLIELLDNSAISWSQKPAFVEGESAVSYAELSARTYSLAATLAELSIAPGSRIGLHFPNGIAYVELTFALWRLEAIVVPIPIECTEEEISAIARSLQLDAMIGTKPREGSVQIESASFLTAFRPAPRANNHGLNIAFIRFTSGTTSARKGVVLCHETVRDRIVVANQGLKITAHDTVIWCLPMSHHFLVTIVLYVAQGATVVLARHVLAEPFLHAINQWRGTVLYASPFHYAMLARDKSDTAMDSVRLAVSTTCQLTQDVAEQFTARFHRPLVQALGVIELGIVSLNTGDPLHRWNSVGQPLNGVEVRVLSPDDEGRGEIAVRGPGTLDAYASPWMSREEIAPDGWFRTGDIGRIDADGYLFLHSRRTAVINLAGRKVFPEEIEAVLNRHPAVRESRAYGRPHPHLGEVIEADLVLDADTTALESVRAHCRTHLAPFKIPTHLNVVTELPRTAVTGKIRREVIAV